MKQTTFSMILLLILGFAVICVVVVEESVDMRNKHLKSMIEALDDKQFIFEEKLVELERYVYIQHKGGE